MAEKIVDVTGTMAKAQDGWQRRTEELAKPEFWDIVIIPSTEFWVNLTPEEQARMQPKINLVRDAAKYMLCGMVKGTVKYATDDWTLERWMAHIVGEGADQMNYQLLTFAAFHKEKEEKELAIERTRAAWKKG